MESLSPVEEAKKLLTSPLSVQEAGTITSVLYGIIEEKKKTALEMSQNKIELNKRLTELSDEIAQVEGKPPSEQRLERLKRSHDMTSDLYTAYTQSVAQFDYLCDLIMAINTRAYILNSLLRKGGDA